MAGPGDTIYVLDYLATQVLAFGGSGEALFSFGRTGEGPGEFTRPRRLRYLDGTVYVLDRGLYRISAFDTRGRFQKSWHLQQATRDFVVHEDCAFLATSSASSLVVRMELGGPLKGKQTPILDREPIQDPSDAIRVTAYQGLSTYLAIADERLVYVAGASSRVATMMLDDMSAPPTWADLKSDLIDDYLKGYRERQKADSRRGGFSVPSWCRQVSTWLKGTILVNIWANWGTPEFHIVSAVFDPTTGEEVGYRISVAQPGTTVVGLLGDNLIGAVNGEESTVEVYRLPTGWREWER